MITPEKLNKMDQCRHLLDAPAPQVVGELIEEIRRLREALTYIGHGYTRDLDHIKEKVRETLFPENAQGEATPPKPR
jgi:hypothetical protein